MPSAGRSDRDPGIAGNRSPSFVKYSTGSREAPDCAPRHRDGCALCHLGDRRRTLSRPSRRTAYEPSSCPLECHALGALCLGLPDQSHGNASRCGAVDRRIDGRGAAAPDGRLPPSSLVDLRDFLARASTLIHLLIPFHKILLQAPRDPHGRPPVSMRVHTFQ